MGSSEDSDSEADLEEVLDNLDLSPEFRANYANNQLAGVDDPLVDTLADESPIESFDSQEIIGHKARSHNFKRVLENSQALNSDESRRELAEKATVIIRENGIILMKIRRRTEVTKEHAARIGFAGTVLRDFSMTSDNSHDIEQHQARLDELWQIESRHDNKFRSYDFHLDCCSARVEAQESTRRDLEQLQQDNEFLIEQLIIVNARQDAVGRALGSGRNSDPQSPDRPVNKDVYRTLLDQRHVLRANSIPVRARQRTRSNILYAIYGLVGLAILLMSTPLFYISSIEKQKGVRNLFIILGIAVFLVAFLAILPDVTMAKYRDAKIISVREDKKMNPILRSFGRTFERLEQGAEKRLSGYSATKKAFERPENYAESSNSLPNLMIVCGIIASGVGASLFAVQAAPESKKLIIFAAIALIAVGALAILGAIFEHILNKRKYWPEARHTMFGEAQNFGDREVVVINNGPPQY